MRQLHSFIAFAIALSACASINNEEVSYQKVALDESKDITVEKQFIAEELSSIHLKAFEQKGIEKLGDFADYLNIISDHAFEEEFRNRAQSQVRRLFIINSEIRLNDGAGNERIDFFLDELMKSPVKTKIIINEITVDQTLKETVGSLYEGTLNFTYTLFKNEECNIQQKGKAEFFLMKIPKAFGTNQKLVWEIFLGDIY